MAYIVPSDLTRTRFVGLLPAWRGRHQPEDGLVYLVELLPRISVEDGDGLLHGLEFLRELRVRRDNLPEPRKGTDDVHTHLHSARRVEDRCRHNGAMLGESDGPVPPPTPTGPTVF